MNLNALTKDMGEGLQSFRRVGANKQTRSILDKIQFPVHASMLAAFVILAAYLGMNCHHLADVIR
jgi:hypothetical protein